MEKTNVMRILDSLHLPYEAISYPVDENDLSGVHMAEITGLPAGQVFKTRVLKGEKTGFFVCCLPSDEELDLKKAARAAGDKKADLIPMKDLKGVTGYIRGGCSPIGMKKKFPTFFDQSARQQPTIMVSGGKIGCQVEVEPDRLVDYTGGSYQPLTVEEMA